MNAFWMILPALAGAAYFIFAFLLKKGLDREYEINDNYQPSVSVIVAARNEAQHIIHCLKSLDRLDYPDELIEILVINDRSRDNSGEIIKNFIRHKPQFNYIDNKKLPVHLTGKANAISQAVSKSRGEIIFITDADCEVPTQWIKKGVSYFKNRIGMIAGFTMLNHSNRLFSHLQNLDWAFLLSAAAGAAGIGIPLSCIGNNFAIRRKVLDEVGGYEGVGFNVAEDFALLQAVDKKTRWKINFPIDADFLVHSRPMQTLVGFFKQRKRWAIGGQSVYWFGKLLIFIFILVHLILATYLLQGYPITSLLFGLSALSIGDLFLLWKPLKTFKKKRLLFYLPIYKIFSIFYLTTLFIILLINRKVYWKGIKYSSSMILERDA